MRRLISSGFSVQKLSKGCWGTLSSTPLQLDYITLEKESHMRMMVLQEWMSALLNCLPAAQRARARLHMELSRMQARA